MSKLNVMYMGTPDFAEVILKKLAETYDVSAVVTQTDKPVGRKRVLTAPPVKVTAKELGIPVYQFETLRNGELKEALEEHNPDVIVVAAYGKLLPDYVLSYPKYGCVNVHGSLLPKYRGAGPVQWSVINGDKVTGVTTMLMGPEMDKGDMLMKAEVEIGEYETYGELMERLAPVGANLTVETLEALARGEITPQKQDDSKATYAPMLNKEIAVIDFNKSADDVLHLIHGLNPWPVAFAYRDGKKLKIFNAIKGNNTNKLPGTAWMTDKKDGLEIACGDGKTVIATVLQGEGAKKMEAKLYLMGNPIKEAIMFTEE